MRYHGRLFLPRLSPPELSDGRETQGLMQNRKKERKKYKKHEIGSYRNPPYLPWVAGKWLLAWTGKNAYERRVQDLQDLPASRSRGVPLGISEIAAEIASEIASEIVSEIVRKPAREGALRFRLPPPRDSRLALAPPRGAPCTCTRFK